MPIRRSLPTPAVLAALAVPSAIVPAAPAEGRRTIDKSPLLWATVNICDTKRFPNALGIRASMPGSGRKGERMVMRFRAQYFSEEDNLWHNFTAPGLDSGPVGVGSARYRARQSGWVFRFDLRPGERFELRGVVKFEWRRRGRLVRRASKRTRAHRRPAFADPKGYSAATCVLRG